MNVIETFEFEKIKGFKFGKSLFGKPKLFSHIYFIDGLMIDTGHTKMASKIFHQVKDLPVKQIFITHHHEDHSGNITAMQSHFDCPVYASDLCSEMMKSPPPISFAQKISWGTRPSFQNIIPTSGFIETDNYKFEIIPIPGHAVDMVALYEPNKKWLFSADLYVNSYIAYFLENESTLDQINSIKRILELDFDVMLCGHNPQFKNGKEKLKKKLLFLEKLFEDIYNLYEKKFSAEQIFKKLKYKEFWYVRIMSNGHLSKLNMVKSVIRDIENEK
jgi:glyoxylase-like metal-dependent hydrolase (beta-lactamase superfamily II)